MHGVRQSLTPGQIDQVLRPACQSWKGRSGQSASSRAVERSDRPGGEAERTFTPVWSTSQCIAAFARAACQEDVTTTTSRAPTRSTSLSAFARFSTVVRASGSTTSSRASPAHDVDISPPASGNSPAF